MDNLRVCNNQPVARILSLGVIRLVGSVRKSVSEGPLV